MVVPGVVIVGREHVAGPHAAGEVVVPAEVPLAAALDKPAAAAGAAGHVAGDGDDGAAAMLPEGAAGAFAGFSGLTIERIARRIPIRVVRLVDLLIIGPTGSADYVRQVARAIGRDEQPYPYRGGDHSRWHSTSSREPPTRARPNSQRVNYRDRTTDRRSRC